ncbi:MAG: cysteate synthase [Treponema sp.]|nr:cysteate synthase [Treponema sp.]
MKNNYKLKCLATNEILADDGLLLANPAAAAPALMRSDYDSKTLQIRKDLPGIFRYFDWLPVNREIHSDSAPVTYASKGLGKTLGLDRLYITFSGYWPDIGVSMTTGTFKECEAYAVCARLPADSGTLVLASAGNTARAFMKVASDNHINAVIVIPERGLGNLWSLKEINPCVKIVAVSGNADYSDAIKTANTIATMDGFINEGGAKNVGRRDGMGTTVLSAAETIGEIPDYYFQAVGSGTGAIAAHEANLRLSASGAFSRKMMRLIVSQNLPFIPMVQAWKQKSRDIAPMDEEEAKRQLSAIDAKVLSNRQPPYGITGGLFDALVESDGDIDAVDNDAIRNAQEMFFKLEGWDICPESGVALASLIKRAQDGLIDKNAVVMLNVTGGGMEALAKARQFVMAKPNLTVDKDAAASKDFNKLISVIL